jgi:hypothetical protein
VNANNIKIETLKLFKYKKIEEEKISSLIFWFILRRLRKSAKKLSSIGK